MTTVDKANRLQSHLANMIALENAIDQKLEELIPKVASHPEVTELLTKFQRMAADQREALTARLQDIGKNLSISNDALSKDFAIELNLEKNCSASNSLQAAYTMLSQAIIGYAVLHPLATRFADSLVIAEEGTSYHLCRQHGQSYIEAVQEISRLIPDVVLWELDQEHLECQCTCPSCGVGVCVCALAGKDFLREAWREAGPIAADEGVFVQAPRQSSAASEIGLNRGDVILGAGGQKIESYGDLQNIFRNAKPGNKIRLTVHRYNNGNKDVVMARP